ncbi:DUF2264 domain-containing protein [Streptomyces sp. NPDC051940]|uniref:DUF2264 domain-containing protein n=1 Tax=Streptomyces sp. NPDC051940 TaxID=3155675 RepID=UPI00343AB61D
MRELPLPRHDLSPYTGWTRSHWEAVADRLLDALVPYASPGFAQYRLPGRTSGSGVESDGLEGFARSFLLAGFRIAGARGEVDEALIERYAAGLDAGTARGGGEAWLPVTDYRQPMVEAASIAIALHETRPWLWDRLDAGVQERVADWLGGFVGARPHDNNWRLFQVVSEQFLASVGARYAQADIDGGLDRIEDWYLGDGWYTDGEGRHFDYYNGWAMHLYPLLWTRIAQASPGGDGGRGEVYRERLRAFLAGYPHFFGADGAPVHQGRSLTYRFAAVAPVWMGALADCTPLSPGLTRRLASGTLRHFTERGVPDERGLLTLGWYGEHLPTTQTYSGPASPYWASKGFAGLLLPPEHEVWTAVEEPLPVEEADFAVPLRGPGWLLHGTRADGVVRLLNHGADHQPLDPAAPAWPVDPHYAKFAYSTATAPETGAEAWREGVDNHLAVLTGSDAAPGSQRERMHDAEVSPAGASSWHEGPGFRVTTTSRLHGPWEVRVHRVTAPAGATLRAGGHAVASPAEPSATTGESWAQTRTADGLTSTIAGVYGWDTEPGIARATDANAFGPHSATPYLTLTDHPGGTTVHVALVGLTRGPLPAPEGVVVREEGAEVVVDFPDGSAVRG